MPIIHLFQVSANASSAANAASHNALVTSLLVCCGFIVCVSPYHWLSVINFMRQTVDFGSWYYHATVVLMFTNSCINPFIYAAKYRVFQMGVRRLMSRLRLNQQQRQVSAIT